MNSIFKCSLFGHFAYEPAYVYMYHWPKELLIWHLSFGQMAQLILSLTALTLSQLAQNVFLMAHILTIFEPIRPMLHNLSKTLLPVENG